MKSRFFVLWMVATVGLMTQHSAPLSAIEQPPVAPEAPAPAGQGRGVPGTPGQGAGRGVGGRGGPSVVSPQVLADGRVTFRLAAPNAQQVNVTGVPGGTIAMQKNEQGIWTGTTAAPLPADIYQYNFNVDGLSIVDPVNTKFSPAFGRVARSAFQVPGDNAWTPIPGTVRGAIAHHLFHSRVTDDDREFYVYTPPNYDPKRRQPYPVIVLQHGLGDDAKAWTHYGGANTTLDNLINQGKATPMIMVNTLGYGTANGGLGIDAPEMQRNFMRILNEEVMPVVYRQYNASTNPTDHAIAGLSMGGGETILGGLNNLDKFAWFGSFSGAFNNWAQTIPFAQPPASPAVVAAAAGRLRRRRAWLPLLRRLRPLLTLRRAADADAVASAAQASGPGRCSMRGSRSCFRTWTRARTAASSYSGSPLAPPTCSWA